MRLLFAGGGTAGHINPAIAIANSFVKDDADAEIQFVGTEEGLETGLVPRAGYKLNLIKIHGFDRSITLHNLKNVCEIPQAIAASKKIIKEFKPDAVIGTGGYVSGPVLYAATKLKIPTLVHESNAFPGVTTRILAKYVDTVAIGVEDAKRYLSDAKNLILTGTPIRPSLLKIGSFEARRRMKLDERPFLLFFGGSLGARDFNLAVADWISAYGTDGRFQIMMGTGKNNQYDEVLRRFKENGVNPDEFENITVCEYIYEMDAAMAAANLVVSRAGASTLCELTALGKPAILVPSPYVTGNHQEHNARAIERGGGAKMILEENFTADALQKVIKNITRDKETIMLMGQASYRMGHVNAARELCGEIRRLIQA